MGKTGAVLINRDFAKLWYGQAVSRVGDFVFDTTLVLWIATKLGKGRSWAPAAVSGVLIAAVVATLARSQATATESEPEAAPQAAPA